MKACWGSRSYQWRGVGARHGGKEEGAATVMAKKKKLHGYGDSREKASKKQLQLVGYGAVA